VQLSKCDAMRMRRAAIAEQYTQGLAALDGFLAPVMPADTGHAWHLYVLRVNTDALRINRDRVIEELKQRGIGTSVHFIPLHLHTLYQGLGYREGQFPNAEERFAGAISLPIYPGMTKDDVERVLDSLREISREFSR